MHNKLKWLNMTLDKHAKIKYALTASANKWTFASQEWFSQHWPWNKFNFAACKPAFKANALTYIMHPYLLTNLQAVLTKTKEYLWHPCEAFFGVKTTWKMPLTKSCCNKTIVPSVHASSRSHQMSAVCIEGQICIAFHLPMLCFFF